VRHIIPISGKDSLCTAIVQREREPSLTYEYVFNPTWAELPPVHDWLKRASEYLESPIHYVGRNLEEIIADKGILPSHGVRFCTREAKIHPLELWLGDSPATVYYGLRADEPDRVGYERRSKKSPIYPQYPLREMGINLPMVWRILEDRDLLTPFFSWDSVTRIVENALEDSFSVVDKLEEWQYRTLFSWRIREFNCSFCFFMKPYEFVGLLENYPDLFWKAVAMEEETGASDFTILPKTSLRRIAEEANHLRVKRAIEIVTTLNRFVRNPKLLLDAQDSLSATSCGVFCGK
jgi:hypothetical protein